MVTWKRQRWDQKLRRNKQPLLTDHFCGEPSILSGCKRDTTCRSHNYYIKNSLTTGTFRVCPQHSGFFTFSNAGHLLWIKRSAGILVLPIDIACIGKQLLFCGTKGGGDSDEENKAMFWCVYLCTYTYILMLRVHHLKNVLTEETMFRKLEAKENIGNCACSAFCEWLRIRKETIWYFI